MFELGTRCHCAVLSVPAAISNLLAAKEVCENFVEELDSLEHSNETCQKLFASTCLVIQDTEMSYFIFLTVIATSAPSTSTEYVIVGSAFVSKCLPNVNLDIWFLIAILFVDAAYECQ